MSETLKHPRRFLSNYQVIQHLKKKKLIDQNSNDYAILPKDPDKRIILVHVHPRFMVGSSFKKNSLTQTEVLMNYVEMAEAVRKGMKARRAVWPEDQFLWFACEMMLHTHPYWPDQGKVRFRNAEIEGFPYICEKDDALTTDWELVSA